MLADIHIFTDGSCHYKTGLGGAGAYLFATVEGKEFTTEISKGYKNTATGRMEITAVILALESISVKLHKKCKIRIYSDSQYVVNSIQKWLLRWESDGELAYRTNGDLWVRFLKIYREIGEENVRATWVKGHVGHVGNEIADALAGIAYRSGMYEDDIHD